MAAQHTAAAFQIVSQPHPRCLLGVPDAKEFPGLRVRSGPLPLLGRAEAQHEVEGVDVSLVQPRDRQAQPTQPPQQEQAVTGAEPTAAEGRGQGGDQQPGFLQGRERRRREHPLGVGLRCLGLHHRRQSVESG